MSALLDRWMALARRSSSPGAGSSGPDPLVTQLAGEGLLSRYAEPHRRYHDQRHLAEVLVAVDRLGDGEGLGPDDLVVVELAAWFHDAVYDPRAAAGANEEASAALAESVLTGLGRPAGAVKEVAALVRGTATHDAGPSATATALVLFDADLAILGSARDRYLAYAADVRVEYAHVPDPDFRAARSAILRGFLDRPRIYRTATAYDAWEPAARTNLADEIGWLSG